MARGRASRCILVEENINMMRLNGVLVRDTTALVCRLGDM